MFGIVVDGFYFNRSAKLVESQNIRIYGCPDSLSRLLAEQNGLVCINTIVCNRFPIKKGLTCPDKFLLGSWYTMSIFNSLLKVTDSLARFDIEREFLVGQRLEL